MQRIVTIFSNRTNSVTTNSVTATASTSGHLHSLGRFWRNGNRSLLLMCLCILTCVLGILTSVAEVYAQREQLGIRYELFGSKPLGKADNALLNNQSVSASQFSVNAGFRTVLDEEGNWLMINGLQYRYLNVNFPLVGANNSVNQVSKDFHLIFYDFFLFRTFSDKFQGVLVLRPGIFSDFQNIALNHFRLEAVGFVDYFANDNLTLGLGFAYQSSVFGRLINVPVAHIVYNSGDFLIDALLPSRATFWYYPSKQWEFGVDVWLNGSQYKMGNRPAGVDARAEDFYFSNATIGPIVRYNLFEKTYLSLEAGYTIVRRFSFGTQPSFKEEENGQRLIPPFTLSENTWFARLGVQIAY
jgi:hypothetical protein